MNLEAIFMSLLQARNLVSCLGAYAISFMCWVGDCS